MSEHDLTVGHFPQSFDISTVGGWVACRGAGQYSTRYGKIEDMVVGLEVVLRRRTRDPHRWRAGGRRGTRPDPAVRRQRGHAGRDHPGVVARPSGAAPHRDGRVPFRIRPRRLRGVPAHRAGGRHAGRAAAVRRDRVGPWPRRRRHDRARCSCSTRATRRSSTPRSRSSTASADALGQPAEPQLVEEWLEHRNDTSALQALDAQGVCRRHDGDRRARGAACREIYAAATGALTAVPHAVVASCHLSHSYIDGACLYFTFAATPPADELEATYVAMWDAGQRAVLANGGNLSHHHGVGLNRARFAAEALGPAFDVLRDVKRALDPNGILNPGKLGLPSPIRGTGMAVTDSVAMGHRRPQGGCGCVAGVRRAVRVRLPLGGRQPPRRHARAVVLDRRADRVRARRRLRGVGTASSTSRCRTGWSPRSARTSSPRRCSSRSSCCAAAT